jgi:hypothetical protein
VLNLINVFVFLSGGKDLVCKADKSAQVYKRAFTEYTSQLYILKNMPQIQ